MSFPDFYKLRKNKRMTGTKSRLAESDPNDHFILNKCSGYILRYLNQYDWGGREAVEFLSWVLGSLQAEFVARMPELLNGGCDDERSIDVSFDMSDHTDIIETIFLKISEMDFHARRKGIQNLEDLLGQRTKNAKFQDVSEFEKMADRLKTLFNLSCLEVKLCIFLFIISSYDPPERFFSIHLDSEKFSGRKYMCNALDASFQELNEAFNGTLSKSGIIEVDDQEVRLSNEFLYLFQNPSARIFEDKFYQKTPKDAIPLDHHFVDTKQTAHLLRLLKKKPDTPTHVLLHGEPGTGKTSYAYGLLQGLDVPSYELSRDPDNKSKNRRAAITVALNMTNTGSGSILIVDEADNLLNTRNAWHARGETQDKGYLNQLMEETGVRIIWICNDIENIEHSILRRFAFSIRFKPFTRTQRVKLFDNIIRKNRVKRFFQSKDIESLACRYDVNAGTIDLAIKKAMDSQVKSKRQVKNAVEIGLEAYQSLISGSAAPMDQHMTENAYSLDGLNIDGDIHSEIHLLEKFNEHLRQADNHGVQRMNLLFYGPPGTGKSELGRYIANRIERGILCKRLSDILSPYVGMSEKNIRNAFDEAQRQEAVLMIDEVDSVLFPRNKAVRSWESSQTNEFLTAMERFKGVLICTTNMIREIDNAAIRRFSRKIKFDFLEPKGNMTFYKKFLQPLLNQPIDNASQSALLSMKYLTPGDFKVVRDQFVFFPRKELNPKLFVKALGREIQLKNIKSQKNSIGFG